MGIFIFAYGSLMCPLSCARTLQREVLYKPVVLNNYERVFDATGQVYSTYLDKKVKTNFANISYKENSLCHGLMFEIKEHELALLSAREYFYNILDISAHIDNPNQDIIYTYIANSHEEDNDIYILSCYVDIMLKATQSFPEINKQISNEVKSLSNLLGGGFQSVTGLYQ